jgi:hypothetical protein
LVLPQRIRDHRYHTRLRVPEGSSFNDGDLERLEIIRGDGCAVEPIAGVLEHQRERLELERQDRTECFGLRHVVQIIWKAAFRFAHFAVGCHAEGYQPVRVDAGRGFGENPVDHGVDGGVPSDAESHQGDCGGAQPRRFGQDSRSGTKILAELFKRSRNPNGSRGFFHQANVAKLP